MTVRVWNITDIKGRGNNIEVNGQSLRPGQSMNTVIDKHLQRLIDNGVLTTDPSAYNRKKRESTRDSGK